MPSKKPAPNAPVEAPFQGLFLDRPPHLIPPSGFSACNNVRVYKNRVSSSLMGWTKRLGPLNGPICGGGLFSVSNQNYYQFLIIGTTTDIYRYSTSALPAGSNLVGPGLFFITPVYTTGTASASGTAVTGVGTAWNTPVGTSFFRKNVRAGDQISFGSATQNSPTATWYTVQSVGSDTSLTLTTSAGTVAAGPYTIRQCFMSDTGFFRWAFEVFPGAGAPDNNDVILMANTGGESLTSAPGADPIFKWRPTDTFGALMSSFSFTCGRLRRFNNMMIYGRLFIGTAGYQATSIANSDNGLPTSLNTGIAGQYVVSDGPWQIQFLGALGNQLLIYTGGQSGGQIIAANFVGAPTFFNFSTVIRNRGPLASGLVIEFPDRHQFIASDGEWRYNGLFIQPMNDHVWRQLITQLDASTTSSSNTRLDQAICVPAPAMGDVIWGLPLLTDGGGAIKTGYTEHYMEQAQNYLFKPYTQRDTPWTAWLGTPGPTVFGIANFVGPLVGDNNGNVFSLYDADTQNGTAFTSTATFGARIIAGERSRGLIKRIYPWAEVGGNFNLSVALAMQDRVGGPTTLTDTQTFNLLAPTNRFTTHYRRGRVGAVTFSTPGPSQPWTLDGYDWDLPMGSPGGQR